MRKYLLFICLIIFGLISINSAPKEVNSKEKITICHIPPGNPENAHSITISVNALNAHLAHGDSIGDCEEACPEQECPCSDGSCSEECCG